MEPSDLKESRKCHASKTAQKDTFSEKALLALYLNIFIGQGSTGMFRPRHLAEQKLPN